MIPISSIQLTTSEIQAVLRTLKSGAIVQGPQVDQLEQAFASYVGAKDAIAVNTGTAALHAALNAAGIGPGDEVITTAFTFAATANAILMVGATPVFADIDLTSYNLDPESVVAAIAPRTKAVLVVDLYGNPVNYSAFKKICRQHQLLLIADSCQAIGAEYQGKKVGSIADITAFSLYATKNIMTAEGGMITTNNSRYNRRCRQFRNHGQSLTTRYVYEALGYNYRLTDILASIGLEQLKKIESITHQRINHAAYYTHHLANIPGLVVPTAAKQVRHAYHQYTLRVLPEFSLSRDKLSAFLASHGVDSRVYYPIPLHQVNHFGQTQRSLPKTELAAQTVLSIPIHPQLKKSDLRTVVSVFQKAASK